MQERSVTVFSQYRSYASGWLESPLLVSTGAEDTGDRCRKCGGFVVSTVPRLYGKKCMHV